MLTRFKTAALSALIGLGTLAAIPATAQAEGLYLNYGTGHRSGVLPAQGDELVLCVGPRDRRHVGLLGGAELDMIGPLVSVDDKVGDQVRSRRLDENMDALGRPGAALGISDHPAHGIAGGDRTGAH